MKKKIILYISVAIVLITIILSFIKNKISSFIIPAFFLFILCTLYITTFSKKTKSNIILLTIEFFLILTLCGLGRALIHDSSKLNEYMSPETYNFKFDIFHNKDKFPFSNFILIYDFSKETGNISFTQHLSWDVNYIDIFLPTVIDNSSIDVIFMNCSYSDECIEDLEIKPSIDITHHNDSQGGKQTRIVISNIPSLGRMEKILIKFDTKLIPNGIFNFLHHNTEIDTEYLEFRLGNKYECVGDCISKLRNMEEVIYPAYPPSLKDIKLRFISEEGQNYFALNTVNKDILFKKNILSSLGISLLAAAIVMLFQFILKLLKKNENK